MDSAEQQTKNIRNNLEGAAQAATKVARSAAASATGRAGQTAGIVAGQEVQQYNVARGSAGASGGSARDFADQARGLGGLVRLYATVAANIFAVSAAFGALKSAADTTNLVKGLDLLGASSGRNLGQLSRNLVAATDGAISLREAMTATVQTSSAGMTGQNIQRLAMVAKNASLALGVSMPDALNRLSRGVTKLEPELLDELGIFTKIEPAVQAYAREVGKSASQLTDFERRQAFANAVLKEGEEKFSALSEAAANPYDKLLANLKNVAQSGLELVNKVLTPIVKLLSESPTALGLGLAAVAALLVKQAIPAVGQFREGLARSADLALKTAKGKAGEALAARDQLNKAIEAKVEASADAQLRAVEAAEKKMLAIQKDSISKRSAVYQLLKKDIVDIQEKDIQAAEKRYSRIKGDPSKAAEAAASREVIDSIKGQIKAEKDLVNVKEQNRQQIQKDAQGWTVYGIVQRKALDYEIQSKKQAIVSNAAYNASLIGIKGAWTLMKMEIESSGLAMGRFGTAALVARAGLAAVGSAAITMLGALNKAMGIFAVLTGIFSLFSSFASKNSKEMNVFDSAIQSADSSVQNVTRTIGVLEQKGGFAKATIEGTTALSNAFGELADSANQVVITSQKAKESAGGWDKFVDSFFSLFGGGIDKNLATALSQQLVSSFKILESSDLNSKYQETFKQILNVGTLDFETVKKALVNADQSVREKFIKALQQARTELANTASRLEGFKSATDGLTKSYQEFIQSTANSDPLFKVGAALEKFAIESQKVAEGGIKEIEAAFLDLAKSPEKIATLGDAFAKQFVQIKNGFLDQIETVGAYQQAIENVDEAVKKLTSPENLKLVQQRGGAKLVISDEDLKKLQALGQTRIDLEKQLKEVPRDKIEAARNLFVTGIETAFAKSAEFIKTALGNASEKAKLTLEKARIGALSGERRAEEENRIALKQIDLQIQAVKVNISLIDSQEKLAATIAESNAIATEARLKESGKATPTELDVAKSGRQAAQIYNSILQTGKTIDQAILEFEKITREGITPITRALITSQVSPGQQRRAAQQATEIGLRAERGAQQIVGAREIRAGRAEDLEKVRALNQSINDQELTRLNLIQSISGIASKSLIEQQNELELVILRSNFERDLKVLRDKATDAQAIGAKDELKILDNQIALLLKRQSIELENKGLQNRQRLLQEEIQQLTRKAELEKLNQSIRFAQESAILELKDAIQNYDKETLNYTQEYIRQQQYSLELERARTKERQAITEAERTYQEQVLIARARIEATPSQAGAIQEQLALELEKRNQAVELAKLESSTRQTILELQKKSGDEQDRVNRLMETTKSLSEGLSAVFGSFGEKLGGLVQVLVDMNVQMERNARTQQELYKKLDQTTTIEEAAKVQKEIDNQRQKSAKDELTSNAKLAGGVKGLFKEKTLAYKTFATLEKSLYLARLAMEYKELAVKLMADKTTLASGISTEATQTATTQAGALARVPTYIGEIYAKSFGQLGPIAGPIAASALVALVLSYLGGSSGKVPAGVSAAERQETQGTGMAWVGGQKVETGGGVFGDPTAKSESISKSLKNLQENSVDGLRYSNQMVKLLASIETNIGQAAKSLFGIQGVRTGTMFGTVEGTQSKPSLAGIMTLGLLGGLLSNKTTKTIIDSGIVLKGTFEQLAGDVSGAAYNFYETVNTTTKKWYGRTKTSINTQTKEFDDNLKQDVQNIFKSSLDLFKELGKDASITQEQILQRIRSVAAIDVEASLRGLTGEEQQKELSSIISNYLDTQAEAVFSFYKQFAEFGEGLLETVVRVTDEVKGANQQLRNLGLKSIEEAIPTTKNITWSFFGIKIKETITRDAETVKQEITKLTEELIKSTGGYEKFIESTQFFRENFLTEAERLVPIQKEVTDTLQKVGLGFVDTREEFASVVKGLDLTTQSGRELFATLMEIAPAFAEVYGALEETTKKALSAEELRTKTLDQELTILKLLGKDTEALALQRSRELAELAKYPKEQADILIANQKYIYALEDEQKIKEQLIKQQDKLKNTIATLKSAIDNLNSYRQGLMGGELSTLTPSQKYQQAQLEFASLRSIITSTPTTETEKAAQQAALSKFPAAADKFLQLSRTLFASGSQYTEDFSTVANALQSSQNILESQKTYEEQQLTYLETTVALLNTINQSIIDQKQVITDTLIRKFNDLDVNLDGILSNEEFIAGLTGKVSGTEISRLWQMLDVDNDKLISVAELTRANTANTTTNVAANAQVQATVQDALATINNSSLSAITTNTALSLNKLSLLETTNYYLSQINQSNSKMANTTAGTAPTASKGGGMTTTQKVAAGAGIAALAFLVFSDSRLKKNIKYNSTTSNGINLYDFEYKDSAFGTGKKRGVIAQDIMQDYPDAVIKDQSTGYLSVDYNKLPISKNLLKFAEGGLAPGGLAIVGEQGPELVDFKTPGRVYTAEETFGMFNSSNTELISEVRELRKEVQKLRTEQKAQTGEIIISNAQVTSATADAMAKAVGDGISRGTWTQKLVPAISR